MPRRSLAFAGVLLMSLLSGCDEHIREIVYLETSTQAKGADLDAQVWDRFEKVLEVQAIAAGANRIGRLDSYPHAGCRSWWKTRDDATISFSIHACPQIAWDSAKGAPSASVITWPRWWSPVSIAEAAVRRAALYEALRVEFGDRVRVVNE